MNDAPSGNESDIQAMHESMYSALAQANTTWARIENAMSALLEQLIGYTSDHVAFHIYFAPNNTETRFNIVDTIAQLKWRDYPTHALMSEWASLKASVYRAKLIRNRIAHGEIHCPAYKIKGRMIYQVRLTASSFDIGRSKEERKLRQRPGLSTKQVKATADQFFELAIRIEEMTRYWEAHCIGPHSSLPERFARIVERRQNSGPLQADLKPAKPKAPFQSSGPKPKPGETKPSSRQRRDAAMTRWKS